MVQNIILIKIKVDVPRIKDKDVHYIILKLTLLLLLLFIIHQFSFFGQFPFDFCTQIPEFRNSHFYSLIKVNKFVFLNKSISGFRELILENRNNNLLFFSFRGVKLVQNLVNLAHKIVDLERFYAVIRSRDHLGVAVYGREQVLPDLVVQEVQKVFFQKIRLDFLEKIYSGTLRLTSYESQGYALLHLLQLIQAVHELFLFEYLFVFEFFFF